MKFGFQNIGAALHSPNAHMLDLSTMPQGADAEEYDTTLRAVVRAITAISSDIAVYDFGHVSCPGISDIDLLVVVPESLSRRASAKILAACHGRRHFFHGPLVANAEVARELGWMLPGVVLRHLDGPDPIGAIAHPEATELPALSAADIVEGATARWVWFNEISARGAIDPRSALLGLWALRRLVDHKRRLGLELDAEESAFCDAVRDERDRWKTEQRLDPAQLRELIVAAVTRAEALVLAAASSPAVGGPGASPPSTGAADTMRRGKMVFRRSNGTFRYRRYRFAFGRRHRSYIVAHLPARVFDYLHRLRSEQDSELPLPVLRRQRAIAAYRDGLRRKRLRGAATPADPFRSQAATFPFRLADAAIAWVVIASYAGQWIGEERATLPDR